MVFFFSFASHDPLVLTRLASLLCRQLYDVITDYLFLFSLIDERKRGAEAAAVAAVTASEPATSNLLALIIVSAGSIGAAFVINLLLTSFILLRERRRPDFAKVPPFCPWGS